MLAALGLLGGIPAGSMGADFCLQFDNFYGGAPPASTTLPWMDATFKTIAPGRVSLSLSNINLVGNENVDQVYFNINPALAATKLRFKSISTSGGFDLPKLFTGEDKFKAGGDGRYDLEFMFTQGGSGANRFGAGEFLVGEIYGLPTLTAADFSYLSTYVGGAGPFYGAAHVQRIAGRNTSGWIDPSLGAIPIPMPEPTTGALWIAGLLVVMRRLALNRAGTR
jgi:hypothetical protein